MRKKGMDGKKLSREKLRTGGVIAALAASVAVFIVMVQVEKNMLAGYEKGTIYTAATEIPKGQLVTKDNLDQYFVAQQLDKNCIPATALISPDQVTELAAAFDIDRGVLLTEGMFQSMSRIEEEMEHPVIAGFKADDIYQVAGGVLRAGDRVDIYSVRDGETSLVWPRVYVQQVFDASGTAISNGDKATAAQRINVLLEKSEVADFYAELADGSLRAVKLLE